jgi:hypothetical protein
MVEIFAILLCFHLANDKQYCHLYPSSSDPALMRSVEACTERAKLVQDLHPDIVVKCGKKNVPTWEPAQ